MIDLKALARYARRCDTFLPVGLHNWSSWDTPSDPLLDSVALTNAWLESWDEIEDESLEAFADHLGLENAAALKAEIVLQGVRLTLEWVRVHGQVPRRFAALERLVIEDVQQMGEIE